MHQGVDRQLCRLGALRHLRALLAGQVHQLIGHCCMVVLGAGAAVERQRGRPLETLQLIAPEITRSLTVPSLQQGDEVAVARRRRQLYRHTGGQALVDLEELIDHAHPTPGIEQHMVVAEDEAELVGIQQDQAQAERHFLGHIEALAQLRFQFGLKGLFVLIFSQVTPVQQAQCRLGAAMDDLHHALTQVPAKRGAQHVMARNDRFQASLNAPTSMAWSTR